MLSSQNEKQIQFSLADPSADMDNAALLAYFPNDVVLQWIRCQFVHSDDVPGTTSFVRLDFYDGGTDGTSTGAIANRGSTTVGWTSGQVYSLTISDTTIAAGRTLTMLYAETGTIAFKTVNVSVGYLEYSET